MRILFILSLMGALCQAQSASNHPELRFEDVGASAGLSVAHISSPEKKYIIESMSGGIGFIDCNNDGKLDIVTVNGSNVDRYRQSLDTMVTLYHQDSDLHFTNITKQAGLDRKGWGMGVAVADFDNDGKQDLYVTGFGGNALYRNKGNCVFEEVTERAGVATGGFSVGAAWADFDRDGHVDLFVPRYVNLDINNLPEFGSKQDSCAVMGVKVQCGPLGLAGETNVLYRNRGDGTFENVTKRSGLEDLARAYGMQALWFDYDNDDWPDLFVANDAGPNYLYHNQHDGTFEDVSLISGTALDGNGKAQGSMGADAADFDHDGRLDLFVTNFSFQYNTLYQNLGEQGFADVSLSSKLGPPSYKYVKWGTAFFDIDNDGWPDILVTAGHVFPQSDSISGAAPYREPLELFRNNGDKTFDDVTPSSGLDKLPLACRHGAAFGDVNNDGKVDVVILNLDEPPTLLINRTKTSNHSVTFRLVGVKSNKAAIGARITVKTGYMTQFNEIRGGSSYMSQNDLRLHFGLRQSKTIDSVEIAWPSGQKEVLSNLPTDFIYTVVEGQGVTEKAPFNAN